jgi:hypothetical protein
VKIALDYRDQSNVESGTLALYIERKEDAALHRFRISSTVF